MITRKHFISSITTLSLGVVTGVAKTSEIPEAEPISQELTKEFVIAGHNDLPKVKEMLKEFPTILNCSFDWGKGDFEMAIEGAGHVGNDSIARYLIKMGTRPNIFTLTMLGELDIVSVMLENYPDLLWSAGPHGLSLYHHAGIAVKNSNQLKDLCISKGLDQVKIGQDK